MQSKLRRARKFLSSIIYRVSDAIGHFKDSWINVCDMKYSQGNLRASSFASVPNGQSSDLKLSLDSKLFSFHRGYP